MSRYAEEQVLEIKEIESDYRRWRAGDFSTWGFGEWGEPTDEDTNRDRILSAMQQYPAIFKEEIKYLENHKRP